MVTVNDSVYRKALEVAEVELENVIQKENEAQQKLNKLRNRQKELEDTVDSLNILLGEEFSNSKMGITDAIRKSLSKRQGRWFSPRAVRAVLKEDGFPIDSDTYSNPMAVIHTTLKRLLKQGELKSSESKSGTTLYFCDKDIGELADIPF